MGKKIVWLLFQSNLMLRILLALIIGGLIAIFNPELGLKLEFLGDLFIKALRSVAPILVFMLVISSIANNTFKDANSIKSVAYLYMFTVLISSFLSALASYIIPTRIALTVPENVINPPSGVSEVIKSIVIKFVDNPVVALAEGNYLSLLAWSVALGIIMRSAADSTKISIKNWSDSIIWIIRLVICVAPYGILGLVASQFTSNGLEKLQQYVGLLSVLVGLMLFVAFIVNPIIVYIKLRKNPYPLIWLCIRHSGITAFFTRSSAANIPVNIRLAERMQLPEEIYSLSIPLGVTMSMNGAAITITTMTMAAAHTLGLHISFIEAFLLSLLSTICALGASGVAGGSLLLIPVSCSLFGIQPDISAQVVAVGFIISIIQDSAETALNSSSDMLFTSVVSLQKQGRDPTKIELLPE